MYRKKNEFKEWISQASSSYFAECVFRVVRWYHVESTVWEGGIIGCVHDIKKFAEMRALEC